MHDADDIIQLMSRAFSETPQPGPEALFNDHCCECFEVSAAYGGKRWMDICLDDILAGRETALLTAAAWRYYLPGHRLLSGSRDLVLVRTSWRPAPAAQPSSVSRTNVRSIAILERSARCGFCCR